jgi:hypothetical protein
MGVGSSPGFSCWIGGSGGKKAFKRASAFSSSVSASASSVRSSRIVVWEFLLGFAYCAAVQILSVFSRKFLQCLRF